MTRLSWLIQVVFVGSLTCSWLKCSQRQQPSAKCVRRDWKIKACFEKSKSLFVADNFYGIINASLWNRSEGDDCLIFLQKNSSRHKKLWKKWPQIEIENRFLKLYIPKQLAKKNGLSFTCFAGNCTQRPPDCGGDENLYNKTVQTSICKEGAYNETYCSNTCFNDKYVINLSKMACVNCDNPVKEADEKITLNITGSEEGQVDASQAVELVKNLGDMISQMNGTSAAISMGEGIEGILVKNTEPEEEEEVSFAYNTQVENIKIIEEREKLGGFSRAVTVPKEAFEKALETNINESFAAVFRFLNMTKDDLNSTILGDEVVAIEMGAAIKNLTDKINIHFNNFKFDGIPQCRSWDGAGDKPNWTDEGCETKWKSTDGKITCQCEHLTFFAVLLTPNEPIKVSDLRTLTTLTQTGCGLSMFSLGIMFFMHFLLRKTKAVKATMILIQLALSMFLLNLTFLINSFVAGLNNSVGCVIMAAIMHYFMLATFSWFAAQAFHFWLQIYKGGRIEIQHYILKISALTWLLPSVVAVVLIISQKYGVQTIYTDNPEDNVYMCWITDNDVHYIVNIGYYVLVFLFTFFTAIFILTWLFCIKRSKMSSEQGNQNGKNIATILGLCCVLGITWGFAFLAYGPLRLPALYIFTILNSFQGFFLFIYYYNTRHSGGTNASESSQKNLQSNSSTCNTVLETIENPYMNPPAKNKK